MQRQTQIQPKVSRTYGDTALFGVQFFGTDELITQPNITRSACKTFYRLFVFDVSKQKEKLKTSVVDIKLKETFTESVAANKELLHWSSQTRYYHSSLMATKCL